MSDAVREDVWKYSHAKTTMKLVLVCIADNASTANRTAVMDIDDMAERCGMQRRWLLYNLDKLEEIGEIEKIATHTYRVRIYIAKGGYLDGRQLNVYPEHYPKPRILGERSDIKHPARRQALKDNRQRKPSRKRRA